MAIHETRCCLVRLGLVMVRFRLSKVRLAAGHSTPLPMRLKSISSWMSRFYFTSSQGVAISVSLIQTSRCHYCKDFEHQKDFMQINISAFYLFIYFILFIYFFFSILQKLLSTVWQYVRSVAVMLGYIRGSETHHS